MGQSYFMNATANDTATIGDVLAYWNRRPCNIRHSSLEVGSRDYFNEVEERKYFIEPHIPGFAEFSRWKGKRVLEVGCGIGTDAINFARAGAVYSAIELSEKSLAVTQQRFDIFGLNGELICGNAEELDKYFPEANFDLIYSFGVIHHTPRPRAVIEAARRLIRPDGELKLMLYARQSWKAMMIEAGFDQPEAQTGCPIALTFANDEVGSLLDGLFRVREIRQDHIFPYVIEKYLKYEYELQPWFKAMPTDMFAELEKRLGWHLLISGNPV